MLTPGPGLSYDRILRGGRPGWGWGLLGVVTMAIAWLFVVPGVLVVAMMAALALVGAGDPVKDAMALLDTDAMTPSVLAMLNVILGSGIPIVLVLVLIIHGIRPGWVTSVAGHLRWGWMAICFGLATVALIAMVLVSTLISVLAPSSEADAFGGTVNAFTSETAAYLVVIVLLTPIQAAAEEYIFRGYLTQAVGMLGSRILAVMIPAFLFACAHAQSLEISSEVFLGQTYPIFVDRFAFGVVAGILVIVTGGLEAGIAMHVLNNFVAFGAALAFSDMNTAMTPTEGSWWQLPVTLTQSLVFLGLVWLVGRMTRVQSVTVSPDRAVSPVWDARVLEAPNPSG